MIKKETHELRRSLWHWTLSGLCCRKQDPGWWETRWERRGGLTVGTWWMFRCLSAVCVHYHLPDDSQAVSCLRPHSLVSDWGPDLEKVLQKLSSFPTYGMNEGRNWRMCPWCCHYRECRWKHHQERLEKTAQRVYYWSENRSVVSDSAAPWTI